MKTVIDRIAKVRHIKDKKNFYEVAYTVYPEGDVKLKRKIGLPIDSTKGEIEEAVIKAGELLAVEFKSAKDNKVKDKKEEEQTEIITSLRGKEVNHA